MEAIVKHNLGGQLFKVVGEHFHRYDYVRRLGYDKFGQRIYMQYCNGTETFYGYDARNRRMDRLLVKGKNKGNDPILIRNYQYDDVGNITAFNGTNSTFLYPTMHGSYEYDNLYRLVYSVGFYYAPYDSKEARYELFMAYDNMHRIRWKKQDGYQSYFQFDGKVSAGYELRYGYHEEPGRTFRLSEVQDDNYRSREKADDALRLNHRHGYEYDANGNLVHINTARVKKDGVADGHSGQRRYRWDEENRLLAASDGGYVSHYLYDVDGERTVKTSGDNDAVYVNSEFSGGNTGTTRFTLYVSPYYVASPGGRYTKHVYIGGQRVVSKLGQLKIGNVDPRITAKAGGEDSGLSVDYLGKYAQQLEALKDNYRTFDLPYNGADNTDPDEGRSFCCEDGRKGASGMRAAADNFHEADAYQRLQFYYHSDHLGNSTYITNLDAEVTQHIEYVPFGEVFIEERNNTWNTPYLFNAKELDEETGLYYYGARYYDPRLSLWMSVDPLKEKARDVSPYVYCNQNPIIMFDPDGKKAWIVIWATQSSDATGRTRIGHTGVVVENYKLNVNTNGVKRYEPTGTYTYYDLWPSSANLGGKAAVEDVEPVYNSQSFYITTNGKKNTNHSALERYMSRHDMSQIPEILQSNIMENSVEGYGEGYAPDGIIRLNITAEQTYNLQQEYVSLIQQGNPYNGESNNCTTFVANGINKSGVGSIREESITDWRGILVNLNPFHKSFTPNSTYNQLQNSPNTVVVKSAGNKTKESYEDAIIDR